VRGGQGPRRGPPPNLRQAQKGPGERPPARGEGEAGQKCDAGHEEIDGQALQERQGPEVRGEDEEGYPFWFTFVTVPGVEPTNNRAERALRELVVHRKIIGTLRNQKGVQMYETLPTLLATWKQRGLDLQGELSRALTEAWQRMRESERSRRPAA